MKVAIEGLCQRAKNRIREHGNVFFIQRETSTEIFLSTHATAIKSDWFGWFKKEEITIRHWDQEIVSNEDF